MHHTLVYVIWLYSGKMPTFLISLYSLFLLLYMCINIIMILFTYSCSFLNIFMYNHCSHLLSIEKFTSLSLFRWLFKVLFVLVHKTSYVQLHTQCTKQGNMMKIPLMTWCVILKINIYIKIFNISDSSDCCRYSHMWYYVIF